MEWHLLNNYTEIIPNPWAAEWDSTTSHSSIFCVQCSGHCKIAHCPTYCRHSHNSRLFTALDPYDASLDLCHSFDLCLGVLLIHVVVHKG